MSSPWHGPWRGARAVAFGAVAVALGAVSHLAAGGAVPSLPGLTLLAFPVALVALVLTSAPRARATVPVTMGVVQVYLHHGFLLLGDGASMSAHCTTPSLGTGATPHAHGGPQVLDCGSGAALAAAPEHGDGSAMILLHLVATALTTWALVHGDAWLARMLSRVLRGPLQLAPVVLPVGRARVLAPLRRMPRLVVGGGVGRRGPPSGLATC